jgi:phosphatidylserine/phosphatidylglycerophosphate/cardiolipin synthase-like enzyme
MFFRNLYQQYFWSFGQFVKSRTTKISVLLTLILTASQSMALDYGDMINGVARAAQTATSLISGSDKTEVGKSGDVEVGFSPDGAALSLILKVINTSQKSLDVMAYSFTSADITRALLSAKKRGVRVRVLADSKHNMETASSKYAKSALSALINAGAEVRLVTDYAIFHDKVIISDGMHVQTGSFNYSQAAAKSNSENVVVMWGAKTTASSFQQHFNKRWDRAKRYAGRP